ncbi:MAG: DUF1552 domain-containing protein [Gammaproteobacteria bacterium]|nr:DUF1552 domain-containing protein [Gammaproteobacteria bacterium]
MNYLTKKHISRRKLLRGTGVSLALPFLESMNPAGTLRAAELGTPRSRLACIYIPHGAVQDRWEPSAVGRNFEFSPTLQALEPFRDHINIVSGLTLPAAYEGDPSAGANHRRSSRCWLTCVAPGTGPSPTSMDQVAADYIGQDTQLPSLELSLEERFSISYRTPNNPMPMQANPRVVFERLFGDGSSPEKLAARRQQRATILDVVRQEINSLQRTLPSNDRIRMEQYLNDVREVERRLSLEMDALPRELDLPDRPSGIPDNFEDHAMIMFDLIALAWQADITRVSTMMLAQELTNRAFPRSGVNEPFHNCSHHMEIAENINRLATLNAYHLRSTMGYFVARLSATPDGDGSLLDHSLVMYGSGMGDSQNHNHNSLPVVLAGGASGRVAGGKHVRVDASTPISNLLVTMLDKVGVPVDRFADSNGSVDI